MKRVTPNRDEVVQRIYLRSGADDLFPEEHIPGAIVQGINRISKNLSTFESQGSGWTFMAVDRLEVSTAQLNPIGVSSYIPTLERIAKMHTCLNIRNDDDRCFLYCVAASVLKVDKHAD